MKNRCMTVTIDCNHRTGGSDPGKMLECTRYGRKQNRAKVRLFCQPDLSVLNGALEKSVVPSINPITEMVSGTWQTHTAIFIEDSRDHWCWYERRCNIKKKAASKRLFLKNRCPRGDSNSYTFRRYPLKIVCLPISPLGPVKFLNAYAHPVRIEGLEPSTLCLKGRCSTDWAIFSTYNQGTWVPELTYSGISGASCVCSSDASFCACVPPFYDVFFFFRRAYSKCLSSCFKGR